MTLYMNQILLGSIRPALCGIAVRIALVASASLFSGCARFSGERGVEISPAVASDADFVEGRTTEADVLTLLGPPSQIIGLHEGVVFYYLKERAAGSAAVFLIYNQARVNVTYDRAVFFFDGEGVLTDHAFSKSNPK